VRVTSAFEEVVILEKPTETLLEVDKHLWTTWAIHVVLALVILIEVFQTIDTELLAVCTMPY
jgi:hypothetical protein